jgi:multiple antibiotic resistance protein
MELTLYIKNFTGLIAILDPIGLIPIFLAYTANLKSQRARIADVSAFASAVILCSCVFLGEYILSFFGISEGSFRVAGGLLLIVIGFNMLYPDFMFPKSSREEEKEALESKSVAIVPLAIPLIAGPGSISAVILFSKQSEDISNKFVLVGICLVAIFLVWLAMRSASSLSKKIGVTGMNIFSRIMGLILIAIAVEFIAGGIKELSL